ncbi:hypothetical protein [uncultured Mediterranean phage]|nr:hypothetical protein [uncultured Mediterranean phage]
MIKFRKDEKVIEQELVHEAAQQFVPDLMDKAKEKIQECIQKYIGEELLGQEATIDIHTNFNITNDGITGSIEVDVGKIQGDHDVKVTDYQRQGRQVRGYTRTLSDMQAFELPSGGWVTLDTIPDEIIQKIISDCLTELWEINSADVEFEE